MSALPENSPPLNRPAATGGGSSQRSLSKTKFAALPADDLTYEVIAIGKIGDKYNRSEQVSAELLLAPYEWEKRDTAEIIPVKCATIAVGLVPAFLPHTRWKAQRFAGDLNRQASKSGVVELHPKAQAGESSIAILQEVLTSDCIGWPKWRQGQCHPHPISSLVGMPLFRILIDGREAYAPVIEVMRKAFMPDTFWARYMFELGWQRPVPAAKAFGSIWKSANGQSLTVEAFSQFRKYSAQPLAIWGSDPVCRDAAIRMGTNLQSDGYLRQPAYARTRFPFPKPSRWDYHSISVVVPGKDGQKSTVWEIVTRIFHIDYDHGIKSIELEVPTTVSSGSNTLRSPAADADDAYEDLEINDDSHPFFARATQDFLTSETDESEHVPVTRRTVTSRERDSRKAMETVYSPPAVLGSTADHSGSEQQTTQVSFESSRPGAQSASTQFKTTLKSSIQAAGTQLQMQFEDVAVPEPGGRWTFPATPQVPRSAWHWMKPGSKRAPVPRPFEVCCLVGNSWRVYFFESVISDHEDENGGHARAIGMLRTPVTLQLRETSILAIANEWAAANGTWIKLKPFFDSNGIGPITKVSHRSEFEDQVAAIVGKVQELLEER